MSALQPDSVRSLIQISPLLTTGGGLLPSRKKDAARRFVQRTLSSPAAFSAFIEQAARRALPDYALERMWAPLTRPARGRRLSTCSPPAMNCPGAGLLPCDRHLGRVRSADPRRRARALCALVPEIEPHVIRPAGHFPMETHSRALRDYLRGWLKYVG